jgi:hypothetical protein
MDPCTMKDSWNYYRTNWAPIHHCQVRIIQNNIRNCTNEMNSATKTNQCKDTACTVLYVTKIGLSYATLEMDLIVAHYITSEHQTSSSSSVWQVQVVSIKLTLLFLDLQCTYCYFLEDITHVVKRHSLHKLLKCNQNCDNNFQENCYFVFHSQYEGPIISEMQYSDLLAPN